MCREAPIEFTDQFLQLIDLGPKTAPRFEHWNKLLRPTRQFKPLSGMIGNCLPRQAKPYDFMLALTCITISCVGDIRTIADYNPSFEGPENTPWLDVHRGNCILPVTIILVRPVTSINSMFNIYIYCHSYMYII